MSIEKALIDGGYFEENIHSNKYKPHLDTLYSAVIDYGYLDRAIPVKNEQNYDRAAPTEEHFVIRVLSNKREQFEECMADLNIALRTEMLKIDGKEALCYTFKSKNLPELKNIIRGMVKIKEQQAKVAAQDRGITK
ncbi:MAG: hypothetical protein J6Y53_05210 [Alphaproteobacteria bacterium]|nr:hypothetical protein [Alphaproteobacteria bacterium]